MERKLLVVRLRCHIFIPKMLDGRASALTSSISDCVDDLIYCLNFSQIPFNID